MLFRSNGQADALHLSRAEAEQARVLAARVALQVSAQTQIGFAYAQGADGLVAQMQGQERPAFMIAGSSAGDAGLLQSSDAAFALRHRLGRWGLTVSAQSGHAWSAAVDRRVAALRGERLSEGLSTLGLAFDRRFGALETALGLNWMAEDETLLGAHFQPGLGLAGADSLFVDLAAGWAFASDWRVGASVRQGRTTARRSLVVAPGSRLTTRGFAVDVERRNLLSHGDALALRLAQPLRVESGAIGLALPSSWNYATLSADRQLQWLALAPSGRELDAELAWRGALWGGQAATSLYWRRDPGHLADVPDDRGLALRWSRGF